MNIEAELKVFDDDIVVVDGYKYTSFEKMNHILDFARTFYPENKVLATRSNKSLIAEWRVHNMLYDMHVLRSRTKDVDLNLNSKFIQLIYKFLSVFYLKRYKKN